MEPKKPSFGEILRDACMNSTIQGIKYFYIFPGIFSRIFWAVIMIYLTLLASFLTLDLWDRFIELPTRIMIENQFASLSEIDFPAVTICSPNQLSKKRLDHLLATLIDRPDNISDSDLADAIAQLIGFYENIPVQEEMLLKLQSTLHLNRYDLISVLLSIPQQCESFLVNCLWEERRFNCSDLFKPILTPYGYCCSFNNYFASLFSNKGEKFKPLGIKYFGIGFGVSMLVDFDKEDVDSRGFIHHGSTKVFIHSSFEFPPPFDLSLVAPGSESFVSITATFTNASEDVQLLPPESRDCVFDQEASLQFFKEYTSADCAMDCFFNETLTQCNCVPTYAPHTRGRARCQISDLPCLLDNRINLFYRRQELTECSCPRECSYIHYQTSTSDTNMDALQFATHPAYELVSKKNIGSTIIHIFFQNQFFVKQKQETITSTIVIISNLGGVFGLCLGCSAISLVELLFFFTKVLITQCGAKKLVFKKPNFQNFVKKIRKEKDVPKGLQIFH